MDRDTLLRMLREALRHVEEGEARLRRQRALVLELDGDGHDTFSARQLLLMFEDLQQQHVRHLDRLREQLARTKE